MRFFMYLSMGILTSFVAQSVGLAIGAGNLILALLLFFHCWLIINITHIVFSAMTLQLSKLR